MTEAKHQQQLETLAAQIAKETSDLLDFTRKACNAGITSEERDHWGDNIHDLKRLIHCMEILAKVTETQ